MMEAVAQRWPIRCMEDKAHVTATLEDALGWLDEHLENMIQDNRYLNDLYYRSESMSENYNRSGRNNAIREIRRLYIAPEEKIFDFMECDTCRAKPGTPNLCAGCLHNRQMIWELQRGKNGN
jgi:hypothetical protein